MNMKHKIGEIWKDNFTNKEPYSVQFPRHIEGAKNMREAEEKSKIAFIIYKNIMENNPR